MVAWFKRRFGVSAVLTMLGAVVSAVGGLWAFVYENQGLGVPAIVVLVGAFITASGALWSSGERTEFERELRDKSDEIADLNRRIAAWVTGGDGYCYVMMTGLDNTLNRAMLTIVHKGNYPMYDVSIRIADLQQMQSVVDAEGLNWENMNRFHTVLDIGNLNPGEAQIVGAWQFSQTDEQITMYSSMLVMGDSRKG